MNGCSDIPPERQVRVDAIRAVVRAIEHQPERWNQDGYAEGDSYCFAGWTCYLAGLDVAAVLRGEGGTDTVWSAAQNLLGLTSAQAARIFLYYTNVEGKHPTVDELKARVRAVTGADIP